MEDENTKIIDLKLGAQILDNTEDCARDMISIMLESFYKNDKLPLEMAWQQKRWDDITHIILKLKGGIVYCGTPKLHLIVTYFYDALRLQLFSLCEKLYPQFIKEIALVQKQLDSMS